MEPEVQQVLFYLTHIDKHLPVGSLAWWDRGTGLDWVGGKRTGAETTFRAAKGTNPLHGNAGVSAGLTCTLLFTPTDRRMLAIDTEAKNRWIPQATMGSDGSNGQWKFKIPCYELGPQGFCRLFDFAAVLLQNCSGCVSVFVVNVKCSCHKWLHVSSSKQGSDKWLDICTENYNWSNLL